MSANMLRMLGFGAVLLAVGPGHADKPPLTFEPDDTGAPAEAAAEEEAAAPAAAEPARAGNAPRLTLYTYEDPTPEGANLPDRIEALLEPELESDRRFRYRNIGVLLEDPEEAARALGHADLAVHDAEAAFQEMDLGKAKELLTDALKTYQRYLPELVVRAEGIRPMRDAWIRLAKVRYFDGDQAGARDALRYVLVLDAEAGPPLFPPQMKKTVVEARLLHETLGNGTLVVESDPPGAQAYLNGLLLPKRTPTDGVEASAGPNYITYRRRGFQPLTSIYEHAGGGEAATATKGLERYPNNPFAHLDRARREVWKDDRPDKLKRAAEAFGADMLLVFELSRGENADGVTTQTLRAAVYDVRPHRVLMRASRELEGTTLEDAARELKSRLVDRIRYDGVWSPPPAPPKPKWWEKTNAKVRDDFTRFYRWKGFWYVVGGVAGAAVLATAIGVGVSEQQRRDAEALVLFGGN